MALMSCHRLGARLHCNYRSDRRNFRAAMPLGYRQISRKFLCAINSHTHHKIPNSATIRQAIGSRELTAFYAMACFVRQFVSLRINDRTRKTAPRVEETYRKIRIDLAHYPNISRTRREQRLHLSMMVKLGLLTTATLHRFQR